MKLVWRMITSSCIESPPTRGRGLKRIKSYRKPKQMASPPTRGRGLKPTTATPYNPFRNVAPYTGAGIETLA